MTALQRPRSSFIRPPLAGTPGKGEYGVKQYQAWQTMQKAHAIANGIHVVAVNRVGHEGPNDGGLEFWGGSFVAGPFGEILSQAPHDREENLIVECDFRQAEEVRRNWPFFRDRRIDAYEGMTKRFLGQ